MTGVNYKDERLGLSQFQNILLSKNKKKNTYSYYSISLFFSNSFFPFLLIFHLFGRKSPLLYFILFSFFSFFASHFRILGYRSPRGTLNSRWIKNSNRSNAELRWKISKERLNSSPFGVSPAGWWLFRFFSFSVEIYGRFAAWYKCDRKPRWRKGSSGRVPDIWTESKIFDERASLCSFIRAFPTMGSFERGSLWLSCSSRETR